MAHMWSLVLAFPVTQLSDFVKKKKMWVDILR